MHSTISGRLSLVRLTGALVCALLLTAQAASAQTTSFTYQGRLTDAGAPASGSYEMQFKLFDAATLGNQTGSTLTFDGAGSNPAAVKVTNGVFSVELDFGAGAFPGAERYLEIGFRRPGEATFTALKPRQQLTSTPYAVRSLSAAAADVATDAQQLGGVAAGQFVQTGDSRLSDPRTPTTGSSAYIQNTTPQAGTNFNVSGNGTAAGTLSGNMINAATQYNLGGQRILSAAGRDNLFAGFETGMNNTGSSNSFFGAQAGAFNTSGSNNSFFGNSTGLFNTTGSDNSFFGTGAGYRNTEGRNNSFFGMCTGCGNTTGANNSFFGKGAGQLNTTGGGNSFFGTDAGLYNTTGASNSFFGAGAGRLNTASFNSFVGSNAGINNTTGGSNTFVGASSGANNTTGADNSFFGRDAGVGNTEGANNSFFGTLAGRSNTTGGSNSFFGRGAGASNTSSNDNSFFGKEAGLNNTTGGSNTFVGASTGTLNTVGGANTFVGSGAGADNTDGGSNSFFGSNAGSNNTGASNTFVGASAGTINITGAHNTTIGSNANVGASGLAHATAIGAGSVVTSSDTVVLGRGGDTVQVPGNLNVTQSLSTLHLNVFGILTKGAGTFKIDHPLDAANKYLYHSFIESPDMMNIYNGNVTTDKSGDAVVTLPAYFEALNRDFRYQLTVIGQFAQAIVSQEIEGNAFKIRTDKPNVKVSWLVTGIRRDKFAEDNRIQVEVEKTLAEKGKCLYAPLCAGAGVNSGASSASEGQKRSRQ